MKLQLNWVYYHSRDTHPPTTQSSNPGKYQTCFLRGVWLNVDYTKIALLSTIYKLIYKEIYIYNVYTNGFHKNAKIYNLHQEMKKSTIFVSNLKFLSTNLHLKQVSSLQSTPFKGLKSDIQSTSKIWAKSTIYI